MRAQVQVGGFRVFVRPGKLCDPRFCVCDDIRVHFTQARMKTRETGRGGVGKYQNLNVLGMSNGIRRSEKAAVRIADKIHFLGVQ